jgi:hypothetical protein
MVLWDIAAAERSLEGLAALVKVSVVHAEPPPENTVHAIEEGDVRANFVG